MTRAIIRRFQPGDAKPTWDVFFAAVRIGAADHYTEAELIDWVADDTMPDDWGDWLARHFTVVAEDAGRVVGFFMLEADGYLNMTFVLPAYRRTGVASQLLDAVMARARAQAMPRLTVWASRLGARFLAKHGWVIDPAPPPRAPHPIPSGTAEPLEYAMKFDLAPAE
jgi:putative acetyltransferase